MATEEATTTPACAIPPHLMRAREIAFEITSNADVVDRLLEKVRWDGLSEQEQEAVTTIALEALRKSAWMAATIVGLIDPAQRGSVARGPEAADWLLPGYCQPKGDAS